MSSATAGKKSFRASFQGESSLSFGMVVTASAPWMTVPTMELLTLVYTLIAIDKRQRGEAQAIGPGGRSSGGAT